jgi:hypothetical protein
LFAVRQIFGLLGALLNRGECGEGDAGQNRDYRDHDEQFDKGKCRGGFFNHRGYLLDANVDAFEGRSNFIFIYFWGRGTADYADGADYRRLIRLIRGSRGCKRVTTQVLHV